MITYEITYEQYVEKREKREARERKLKAQREARERKREAQREAHEKELLARFQAAETVWRCADDEDDEVIYYDCPIRYFLTKEDAIHFHGDEVEDYLIQVPRPANAVMKGNFLQVEGQKASQAAQEAPQAAQEAPQVATVPQEAPQVPAGITQLSLFDVVPTTDGTLTPTSWTPRSI